MERCRAGFAAWCAVATVYVAYVDAIESRLDRASVALGSMPWGRWGGRVATTASAIAGVDQAPSEDDIVRLADSILSGAFVGDFAVALERAAAFTDVVALGLRVEARRMVTRAEANGAFSSDADEKAVRTKAARLMHTAGSLMATAKDFQHGANLWRRGRLE